MNTVETGALLTVCAEACRRVDYEFTPEDFLAAHKHITTHPVYGDAPIRIQWEQAINLAIRNRTGHSSPTLAADLTTSLLGNERKLP